MWQRPKCPRCGSRDTEESACDLPTDVESGIHVFEWRCFNCGLSEGSRDDAQGFKELFRGWRRGDSEHADTGEERVLAWREPWSFTEFVRHYDDHAAEQRGEPFPGPRHPTGATAEAALAAYRLTERRTMREFALDEFFHDQDKCPHCGSRRTRPAMRPRPGTARKSRYWHCIDCDREFDRPADD